MTAPALSTPSVLERMSSEARSSQFVTVAARERVFLSLLLGAFMLTAFVYQVPHLAMWLGFLFAGYSAVANDSIQTLGTFIASNRDARWWVLWIFIGGIFLATASYSWWNYGGDVSYGRLTAKGFSEAPTSFSFLQVAAPLFLLIVTRLRMPVSTTLLLLTCFATEASGVTSVLQKSVGGYVVAFGCSVVIWLTLGRAMKRFFVGTANPAWRVLQWATTGWLWSVWLMQDAANVAVFLPRSLSFGQFLGFAGVIFAGLGLLFYQRGERIQEVVDEKSDVADVRPAAIIDLVYAFILYYFKQMNQIPMSTTWVFIGLLGGREFAMSVVKANDGRTVRQALALMLKDLAFVFTGLVISLGLAVAINDVVREPWLGWLF